MVYSLRLWKGQPLLNKREGKAIVILEHFAQRRSISNSGVFSGRC